MEELKNSMDRSQGGSGAEIEYVVHLTPTNVKAYYAHNFESGNLIEVNDKPIYFELVKKNGEEKEAVIINIEQAALIEFEIYYVKGKCKYKFEFFY